MANEFRIKNGLIVTGSAYTSESMFAPNLPTETSPSYFLTWRTTDGRFEVTPATATAFTLGCWNYDGYATTPTAGEFTIRGNGSNRLDSNLASIWFHATDNSSANQSSTFNTIGPNSVLTFYINNQVVKYTITGVTVNTTTNVYTFVTSHISGDSGAFNIGDELCYEVTISSSGGSSSASQCLSLQMHDNPNTVYNTNGDSIFNRIVGQTVWSKPYGTVDANIDSILLAPSDLNNTNIVNFITGYSGKLRLNYSNPITGTSSLTTFNYTGYSAGNNGVNLFVTYSSGNSGYTIANNEQFTLCKI